MIQIYGYTSVLENNFFYIVLPSECPWSHQSTFARMCRHCIQRQTACHVVAGALFIMRLAVSVHDFFYATRLLIMSLQAAAYLLFHMTSMIQVTEKRQLYCICHCHTDSFISPLFQVRCQVDPSGIHGLSLMLFSEIQIEFMNALFL